MNLPFDVRPAVLADYQTHRSDGRLEDVQEEIVFLKKRIADLQQLVGELLVKNERLRRSH